MLTSLRQILILGGEFEQEGSGGRGGAGGTLQYVRGNYKSLKGTNLTVYDTSKYIRTIYNALARTPT